MMPRNHKENEENVNNSQEECIIKDIKAMSDQNNLRSTILDKEVSN